jgi:hypothetical protein
MSRSFMMMTILVGNLLALVHPVKADQGDKAGWTVTTDPRKRAFLYYVPADNGSRVLTIGCLRDVDSFTVYSVGLNTGISQDSKATLRLSNGAAQYAVDGTVGSDQATGTQTFDIDIDADAAGRRKIAARLLPVLTGRGPIALSLGTAELALPTSGLAAPLGRFNQVCLGGSRHD